MAGVKTYNSRQVTIVCGSHIVSGLADDSFVEIDPVGDGVSARAGCDGEVARAVDPNEMYAIKLSLLQTSESNAWFQSQFNADKDNGDGVFPIEIDDLKGNFQFQAESAWIVKTPARGYGKDTNNREWQIQTGPATLSEGTYS